MKIVSTQDLNTVTHHLKVILKDLKVDIKTTRLKELLAHSQQYKTANGLINALPLTYKVNQTCLNVLNTEFNSKFQCGHINPQLVLERLEGELRTHTYTHKNIANSNYRIFYDGLDYDDKPLMGRGTGYLKEDIPVLCLAKASETIIPKIIKDITELEQSHAENLLGLKFLIPASISFLELKTFLNSERFVSLLNALDENFMITKPGEPIKKPVLTKKGYEIKKEIDELIVLQFGKSDSPLFEKYYTPVFKSFLDS
ncbi:hypothetical protein RT723_01690 [Psychrosphaera aquimarina]|uniref:Uncharacterized protein n=1 Tax=Psychrosphaera aquimarina TaxID=2044854 RepID=A0ABU3QWE8_9GAMM|nr:hypothetical protein [Psychrosphaera aquimarina]MDU0111742.1 hypothetical protein [Psychrosphaera aquimarina]